MKFILAFFMLVVLIVPAFAQSSNLNTTSSLMNEGIEPAIAPTTVLDGIPLMEGLQPYSENDVLDIFPNSSGLRPLVTIGIVDVDETYNFYKRTLPPLGWTLTSNKDYKKDNETLHIEAQSDTLKTTVTFTEKPLTP